MRSEGQALRRFAWRINIFMYPGVAGNSQGRTRTFIFSPGASGAIAPSCRSLVRVTQH